MGVAFLLYGLFPLVQSNHPTTLFVCAICLIWKDTDKGNGADTAFGANLLGAMAGGVLEYTALAAGYQALLLFAVGAYLLAFVFWKRETR